MCMTIQKIPSKLRRRKTGYKVYQTKDGALRGEYNYLTYEIGETYKARTLDWDIDIAGMALSSEYNKGIHVYLDYPKTLDNRTNRVVKVSFTKPVLYGISKYNYKNQEVALVNEVTLLKEVTKK